MIFVERSEINIKFKKIPPGNICATNKKIKIKKKEPWDGIKSLGERNKRFNVPLNKHRKDKDKLIAAGVNSKAEFICLCGHAY